MPKFKLRANAYFTDAETGKPVMQYNIVETRSRERMLKLINTGLAELVEAWTKKICRPQPSSPSIAMLLLTNARADTSATSLL